MNEVDVMNLVAAQVRNVSGFSTSNVTVGKWGILNSGNSKVYAIIKPGATNRPPLTFSVFDNQGQTIIQVWQRYKDDGTTLTDLMANVDLIVARLDQYWQLADTSNTLRNADVSSKGEVTERWDNDGALSWLSRDIVVSWQKEEAVTYAE